MVSDPFFSDIHRPCGDLCLPIRPLNILFKLFISSPKFQVTIWPCTSSKILGFLENHPHDGLILLGSHLSSGTRHITRTLIKTGARKVTRLVLAVTNAPEPTPLASSPPHRSSGGTHHTAEILRTDSLNSNKEPKWPLVSGHIYSSCLVNPTTSYHYHCNFRPPINETSTLTVFPNYAISIVSISASNLFVCAMMWRKEHLYNTGEETQVCSWLKATDLSSSE